MSNRRYSTIVPGLTRLGRRPPIQKPSRGRPPKLVRPKPVDAHVGLRLRQARMLSGTSQETLARALGLTFQQVQKYERGTNRISASRLFDCAAIFSRPVQWFFDDMPAEIAATAVPGPALGAPAIDPDVMHRRETLELVRSYSRIASGPARQSVLSLAKSLAREDQAS